MGGTGSNAFCGSTTPPGSPSGRGKDYVVEHDMSPNDGSASTSTWPSERKQTLRKTIKKQFRSADSGNSQIEEPHLDTHRRHRTRDAEVRQFLKVNLRQDRICGVLEEPDIEAISDTMTYFEFARGDHIVIQGAPGYTLFVIERGSAEVSVNGKVCNTLEEGSAFGGLAVLYSAPRTATVKALSDCGVWGANGENIHRQLQDNSQKNYAGNRKFLNSINIFSMMTDRQKDRLCEVCFTEVIKDGVRVMTEGDAPTAVYFVKQGELLVFKGGTVTKNGALEGGSQIASVGPGDCFGEQVLIRNENRTATVVAKGSCELLCISKGDLMTVLGQDLIAAMERNCILLALKKSPRYSQFSPKQQNEMSKAMEIQDFAAGTAIGQDLHFGIVIDGQLSGNANGKPVVLERGHFFEDGKLVTTSMTPAGMPAPTQLERAASSGMEIDLKDLVVASGGGAPFGVRLGFLSAKRLAGLMQKLGSSTATPEQAVEYPKRMMLARKVHIFRHLSDEQLVKVAQAFEVHKFDKDTVVMKQGEVASSFFVIAAGEVTVYINGEKKRTMAKNAYLGERALLFSEPRTATVIVSSSEAELWCVNKATFMDIVKGKMHQDLMHRIRLQDTNIALKDVRHVKVIGTGAAGVVRLVQHKTTGMRYALKRVHKDDGKIPEEVRRECDLLAENDHPFIIKLVRTIETPKSVYMVQELLTGGELHDAIRKIPTVLSRAQAQFYAGSLVLCLEELADRNIVYRDLKPENVMLDAQGYIKLIDFGIAKKLEEGSSRTFTLVGTPHYMAPEVMRGHGYGVEVDLWSLGVMLYEFVCGYLPFGDDLDDPCEVCRAVLKQTLTFPSRYRDASGKTLMQGLLERRIKKRLGSGADRFEDVRAAEYFKAGHSGSSLFSRIMGREFDPPVVPRGEVYCESDEVREAQECLSDDGELG